jgi:hypothetical protein
MGPQHDKTKVVPVQFSITLGSEQKPFNAEAHMGTQSSMVLVTLFGACFSAHISWRWQSLHSEWDKYPDGTAAGSLCMGPFEFVASLPARSRLTANQQA